MSRGLGAATKDRGLSFSRLRRKIGLLRVGMLQLMLVVLCVWSSSGHAQGPPAPLPSMHIEVTGDPAPVETLRQAILAAARTILPEARDAQLAIAETAPSLQPLPAASETSIRAVLRVTPSSAQPIFRMVDVTVTNTILPWADAQLLLISNNPESLQFGEVLLSQMISLGQSVRLLYHHRNGSRAARMVVAVEVSNPDPTPIRIWITGAAGAPASDELAVGHAAARVFLDQFWHHAGFLLTVPPNTTLPLFLHGLAAQEVASGLVQIGLVNGARANARVVARAEGQTDPPPSSAAPDGDRAHQRGVFEHPFIVRRGAYAVGRSFLMADVGDTRDALRETQTGTALNGNYGVLYTFNLLLNNPTPEPAVAGLVLQARAGEAGGTMLIDGRMIDVPRVRSGASQLLSKIPLAPGERRTLTISTMPESGGNYPIRLILGAPAP